MTPAERTVFNALVGAIRLIEFGNPAYEDVCPRCGQTKKIDHAPWCQLGEALRLAEALESGREAER